MNEVERLEQMLNIAIAELKSDCPDFDEDCTSECDRLGTQESDCSVCWRKWLEGRVK